MLRRMFVSLLLVATLYAQSSIDYSKLQLHSDSQQNASYVALSSGVLLVGSMGGAVILYFMPQSVTNWNKEDIYNLGTNYKDRISNVLVADRDDWFLNWITHPYWGSVYYMQPRKAGYGWFESALFSFATSALFWEFGIEAFAEVPSWQDLIVTPAFGAMLGEMFYQASMHIYANDRTLLNSRFLGIFALILMDPVGLLIELMRLDEHFGVDKNVFYTRLSPVRSRQGSNGVMLSLHYAF
ncbi:MAG: DUF3943 domain-containing protein [Helicobacter sp.]|uniref:DUF3943 domain-containing protein n=1 Tax=Helicobacter sp. TaxID=218 RepID=UPI002A79CF6B|nr:DUF3943 domain-containing protein [Helicobacter sp.]